MPGQLSGLKLEATFYKQVFKNYQFANVRSVEKKNAQVDEVAVLVHYYSPWYKYHHSSL